MKYLSYIVLFFIIVLCSVSSETIVSNDNEIKSEQTTSENIDIPVHNVKIQIIEYYPYCGGASPSHEELNRQGIYSENVLLIDLSNNQKQTITPNNKGLYLLELKPGNYAIKEMYKNVPFDQFISTVGKTNGAYIIHGSSDCYKNWWESNLKEFTVDSSVALTIVNCSISSSCYTGINPCDYYDGPIPN